MWYWTIPSLVLTGACLIIPNYLNAAGNWAATRHFHRRNYETDHRDYYLFIRDRRVSGNEYDQRGLESLDKPIDLNGLKGWFVNERMDIPANK